MDLDLLTDQLTIGLLAVALVYLATKDAHCRGGLRLRLPLQRERHQGRSLGPGRGGRLLGSCHNGP